MTNKTLVWQRQQKQNKQADHIKLKSSSTARGTVNIMRRHTMEWEKILADHKSKKGLIFKDISRNSYNPIAKINNPINKWAKDQNKYFSREDIETANRYI